MSDEQRRKAEELFQIAVDLEREDRTIYLDSACGGDQALRDAVERLLRADEQESAVPTRFLGGAEGPGAAIRDRPGDVIGRYTIQRLLGEGGFGVVYLARQSEPVRRRVALKVLRPGMGGGDILERFELERQVLSALDHPNIARLLDGGVTDDGRPFFALEYVDGEQIDAYCDSHRLRTEERLRLFTDVCRAVHYAHQNLVIHRDIKPGNILVTKDGVPKLLDFGIVKLLNPDLAWMAETPTGGGHLMTPDYASPEQVGGKPITTASDVYSLGVVLYGLLTGHQPYRLGNHAPGEIVRVVCDQDPQRPSRAVGTTEKVPLGAVTATGESTRLITPETISKTREGRVDRLRRRLRGDVDNIVLMAMHKAPQRRYASAEKLAEDIERHLGGYPVAARPDSVSYRSGKFLRRNRASVAVAGLVLLSAFAGVIAIGSLRVAMESKARAEAEAERRAAIEKAGAAQQELLTTHRRHIEHLKTSIEETREFLFGDVYDAIKFLPGSIPAKERLALRAREMLEGDRTILEECDWEADLHDVQIELARAYDRLGGIQGSARQGNRGDWDGALTLYREAQDIRNELARTSPPDDDLKADLARSHMNIGDVRYHEREYEAAAQEYRAALDISQTLLDRQPDSTRFRRDVAKALQSVGDVLGKERKHEEARDLYVQSLDHRRVLMTAVGSPESERDFAIGLARIARAARDEDDLARAKEFLERSLTHREKLAREDEINTSYRRDVAVAHRLIADVLSNASDLRAGGGEPNLDATPEEARKHLLASLTIFESLRAAEPSNTRYREDLAPVYEEIGRSYLSEQRFDEARENFEQQQGIALLLNEQATTPNPLHLTLLASSHVHLGIVFEMQGDSTGAASEYDLCIVYCNAHPEIRTLSRLQAIAEAGLARVRDGDN